MPASRGGLNLPPAAPASQLIEYHETNLLAMKLGPGSVFMTGESWTGTSFDYVIIKYAAESPSPSLNIQQFANSVVLNWPDAAFGLQSAPGITGTFTNIPGATSPYTNSISAGRQFFWLISN